jgi:hypothetical protein
MTLKNIFAKNGYFDSKCCLCIYTMYQDMDFQEKHWLKMAVKELTTE